MYSAKITFSPGLTHMLNADVKTALRLEFRKSLRTIQTTAQNNHRFTSRTGVLENAIQNRVTAESPLTGEVFVNPSLARYGLFVSEGTKPHTIEPKNTKALRFSVGGKFIFAKRVNHPGTKPDPFLENALDSNIEKIKDNLIKAIEKQWL